MLAAPKVFDPKLTVAGAFAKGSATAPVTVVEFSDFHCPFCKRVQPVVTQLLAKYGDKVRLVYKDFPLDSLHPQARAASEAARCAGEQGKFWEFHDKVYAGDLRRLGRHHDAVCEGSSRRRHADVRGVL